MADKDKSSPATTAASSPTSPRPEDIMTPQQIADSISVPPTKNFNRTAGTPTEDEVNEVVKLLLKDTSQQDTVTNINRVKLTIGQFSQEGATSPKFSSTHTSSEFGITLTVDQVRKAATAKGLTIRKLARALSNEAKIAAQTLKIEGNLSKQYKLFNPKAQFQELMWASDFFTFSDDPSMDPGVREWLLQNYNTRFNKQ